MSHNAIGNAGAAQLAACLCSNATLTSLNLEHTEIGDAGATQLAQSLRVNSTLRRLSLQWCANVSETGAIALKAACQPHCQVFAR